MDPTGDKRYQVVGGKAPRKIQVSSSSKRRSTPYRRNEMLFNKSVHNPYNKSLLNLCNKSLLNPYNKSLLNPYNKSLLNPYNKAMLNPYNKALINLYNKSLLDPYNTRVLNPYNKYLQNLFKLNGLICRSPSACATSDSDEEETVAGGKNYYEMENADKENTDYSNIQRNVAVAGSSSKGDPMEKMLRNNNPFLPKTLNTRRS